MSRYVILDRAALLAEMSKNKRTSVLIVGNHVEPEPIVPLESEFVIVFVNNYKFNKIPPERVDMAAGAQSVPLESAHAGAPHLWSIMYPCGLDHLASIKREIVYLIDPMITKSGHDALDMIPYVFPPVPSAGFLVARALDEFKLPTRLAGFSFYRAGQAEIMHRNSDLIQTGHHLDKESAAMRVMLDANPLMTATPETEKYITRRAS